VRLLPKEFQGISCVPCIFQNMQFIGNHIIAWKSVDVGQHGRNRGYSKLMNKKNAPDKAGAFSLRRSPILEVMRKANNHCVVGKERISVFRSMLQFRNARFAVAGQRPGTIHRDRLAA
jgi:hypothetical protein